MKSAVLELIGFLRNYSRPGWPSPLLWVGAGASAQAGYPTLGQIKEFLQSELKDPFEEADPIEAYVERFSRVDLMNVLENKFGEPREFAPLHLAVAQMAAADLFRCIITTNYDRLIENALESLNIPFTLQIISQNQELSSRRVPLLIKLHGDRTNWKEAVLDASSYARFENDEPLVTMQLNLLRRAHSVIFLGSSMRDYRIVKWLRALRPEERKLLHAGRVLITKEDWEAIPDHDRKLFEECSIQPIFLADHNEIGELMVEVASRLAPIVESHLALEVSADEDEWTIRGPTSEIPPHSAPNLLRDEVFVKDLAELERVSRQSIRLQGLPSDQEAVQWQIAKKVGQRLTSTLLSEDARRLIRARVNQVDKCRPSLIIRVSDDSPWNKWVMALPWELITPDENHFAVYQGQLEIIREVVVDEAPTLAAPNSPLSISVCISAPDAPGDKAGFDHEKESYHLARALDQVGRRPNFTELGELSDLVDIIERTRPSVVHFSGSGSGPSLIFETEQGFSRVVSADELSRRLNEKLRPVNRPSQFPPLFFISNCEGKNSFSVKATDAAVRDLISQSSPDTFVAMALHRYGFIQVVDFSGGGFDVLRMRGEETFYSALAQGETTLQSVARARAELYESFASDDKLISYPLAWIHLRFYHRGPDRPLTLVSPDRPRELVERFHRHAIEIAGLPVLEFGFIGRRALQHEVRRKYQDGRRLFIIHGLGGIGKTAFATQLIHRSFHSVAEDVLVFRCEGLEVDHAITSLKDQAVEHGRQLKVEGWDEVVADISKRHDDPTEALEKVILHLRRCRPALIVYGDGIESLLGGPTNAGTENGEWLPRTRGLWDVINRLSDRGLLVLLSSRSLWEGHDPDSVVFVDTLSGGEMMRMFDSFGELSYLRFENKERLIPRIDGHPRTVELLDKLAHIRRLKLGVPSEELDFWTDLILPSLPDTRDRITADMLLEALWQLLTDAGREHACRLLVARVPLPRQIVIEVGGATDELIRFGLLTRHRIQRQTEGVNHWENRWAMHSIVVDYIRTKVASLQFSEAHLLIGLGYKKFLESKGSSFDDLGEGIYHLHSAEAGDAAWPLTRSYIDELQFRGDFLRALILLEESQRADVSGDNLASLLVTKAHIVTEVTGDTAKAVPLLTRALPLATSPKTREAVLRARGIQLRAEGQLEESERDLRRALRLTETIEGKESLSYATCMHELAVTLGQTGQLLKAEKLLSNSLTIKAGTCGKEHHLYASGLHHLGLLAMRFQNYEKAEPLLREAVAIKRVALGRLHRSYGHSLEALAETLRKLGHKEESESFSIEARAALTFMPGTKKNSAMFFARDISYVNRLRMIAWMLGNEGKEEEASKVRDVLKGMGEDENSPAELSQRPESEVDEIAAAIEEAERQGNAGNREVAIQCLELMGEKAVLSRTTENAAYGALLCRLGNAYRENGEYDKSESCLREAVRVAAKANGEQNPAYAICLASLAETLSYHERHAESYSVFKDALRLLSNSVGRNHHLYHYYLRWYATALSIGMQFGEAEGKWQELIDLNQAVRGEGYPQHARDLRELAALLARQNKLPEAYEKVSSAVDIADRSHGKESEDFVEALWVQVHVGLLMGKPEASTSLPQVFSLVEKYLKPGNKIRDEALWVGMMNGISASVETEHRTGEPRQSELYRQMMTFGKVLAEKESVLQARLKAVTDCDNPIEAVKQTRVILSEAEASGEALAQLSAHDLLSQILFNLGMREEALNHARRAKDIAEGIGVKSIVESAEERIAELETETIDPRNALGGRLVELSEMMHRGEFAAALTYGRELVAEAERLEAFDVVASSNSFLASALEMMGRTEEAVVAALAALSSVNLLGHAEGIKHFQARVQHLQSLDPMQTEVNTLLYRAQLLRGARGDEALETIRLCEEALPMAQSLDNLHNQLSIRKMLAEVFDRVGMKEEAISQTLDALNLSQTLQVADLVEELQQMLVTIKERERSVTDNLNAKFFRALLQKNRKEKIRTLEEVVSEAEELSVNSIACSAHWVLAHSYEAVDNTESAKIHATAAIQFAKDLGHQDAVAQFTAYLDQLESRGPTSSNS